MDGPGVRFVVFLQGCNLRCRYCHNPETWACGGGQKWTAESLFQHVWRYRNYWGKKGGITVSGGEPLLQMEFLTRFFRLARAKKVHTAIDTAGEPFRPDDPAYLAAFDQLMDVTSLVILDLKEIDPRKAPPADRPDQREHPGHGPVHCRAGRAPLGPPCAGARPHRR